jgi:hypothetical protein
MTEITLHLGDSVVAQLSALAEREGIHVDLLVEREITRMALGDPFGFFESGSSDDLRGADVRRCLTLNGSGRGDR